MKEKILVIDDDRELLHLLTHCMEEEFCIHTTISGKEGLKKLSEEKYRLVILDIMLPGMNGLEVLKEIRERYSIPVIMLTAKDSVEDKIKGLNIGADDYLTKPFNIKELMARVHSQIRRNTVLNTMENKENVFIIHDLQINIHDKSVIKDGTEIFLTGKEFELLYFLASSPGRIYTKKQIYSAVWGEVYVFDDDNIMAVISRIRKKLETNSAKSEYIQTVRGIGYRFRSEE